MVVCVGFALARVAHAEPARDAIRIGYLAPEGCPAESAFTSQILARTTKVRIATGGHARRALDVTIEAAAAGFAGHLEMRDEDGRASHRDVAGDTCEDVVAALALVSALTLDPLASTGPLPATPAARPAAKHAEARPAPRRRTPVAAQRAGSVTRPVSTWHWGFGGDVAIRDGATPDAVATLPVFVELEAPGGAALRAAFERSPEDAIAVGGATGAFRWTAGVLELCPVAWAGAGGALRAAPCLRVEAGVLEAAGRQIVPARADRRSWAALGAEGRVEWSFLPPAFVDVGAGVVLPLVRDRFYFAPATDVYRAPALGFTGRVGLGVRFP